MVYHASAAQILVKEKDVTEVPYFAYGEREREKKKTKDKKRIRNKVKIQK